MPCHQGMLREFGPPYNIERFHGIVFTSKSNVTLIKKKIQHQLHLIFDPRYYLLDFFAQLVTKF